MKQYVLNEKDNLYLYLHPFYLSEEITDKQKLEQAQDYLGEDNLVQYFSLPVKEKLLACHVILVGTNGGLIVTSVKANEELTQEDKRQILKEVGDQFADGLGEGFSQQGFAQLENGESIYLILGSGE